MRILFLNIILYFSLSAFADTPTIHLADSAYQNHDYTLAVNLYTQIIADHQYSAPLYYNLGNAYFKNNEIGKALWAYHKAKKIDPQQTDIAFNLNYVSSLTKDKIEQDETGIRKWIAKVFFGHGINFWAIIALICMVAAGLCFYLYKITIPKNRKGIYLIANFVSVFLFIAAFSLAIAHKAHITSITHGIITDPVVKVRTAPSTEDVISFELHEGAKFRYKTNAGQLA